MSQLRLNLNPGPPLYGVHGTLEGLHEYDVQVTQPQNAAFHAPAQQRAEPFPFHVGGRGPPRGYIPGRGGASVGPNGEPLPPFHERWLTRSDILFGPPGPPVPYYYENTFGEPLPPPPFQQHRPFPVLSSREDMVGSARSGPSSLSLLRPPVSSANPFGSLPPPIASLSPRGPVPASTSSLPLGDQASDRSPIAWEPPVSIAGLGLVPPHLLRDRTSNQYDIPSDDADADGSPVPLRRELRPPFGFSPSPSTSQPESSPQSAGLFTFPSSLSQASSHPPAPAPFSFSVPSSQQSHTPHTSTAVRAHPCGLPPGPSQEKPMPSSDPYELRNPRESLFPSVPSGANHFRFTTPSQHTSAPNPFAPPQILSSIPHDSSAGPFPPLRGLTGFPSMSGVSASSASIISHAPAPSFIASPSFGTLPSSLSGDAPVNPFPPPYETRPAPSGPVLGAPLGFPGQMTSSAITVRPPAPVTSQSLFTLTSSGSIAAAAISTSMPPTSSPFHFSNPPLFAPPPSSAASNPFSGSAASARSPVAPEPSMFSFSPSAGTQPVSLPPPWPRGPRPTLPFTMSPPSAPVADTVGFKFQTGPPPKLPFSVESASPAPFTFGAPSTAPSHVFAPLSGSSVIQAGPLAAPPPSVLSAPAPTFLSFPPPTSPPAPAFDGLPGFPARSRPSSPTGPFTQRRVTLSSGSVNPSQRLFTQPSASPFATTVEVNVNEERNQNVIGPLPDDDSGSLTSDDSSVVTDGTDSPYGSDSSYGSD